MVSLVCQPDKWGLSRLGWPVIVSVRDCLDCLTWCGKTQTDGEQCHFLARGHLDCVRVEKAGWVASMHAFISLCSRLWMWLAIVGSCCLDFLWWWTLTYNCKLNKDFLPYVAFFFFLIRAFYGSNRKGARRATQSGVTREPGNRMWLNFHVLMTWDIHGKKASDRRRCSM